VATPAATKIALVATLVVTIGAVGAFLGQAPSDEIDADLAAPYLALLGFLFVVRVVGQIVVLIAAPRHLPPMEQWNLLPYRLLLPIQLVFIALITAIVADFAAGPWLFAEPNRDFGFFLVGLSGVYAASMALRYAVRMVRRPSERWFGGTIPIVFHIVLAAFLFIWGAYHLSY
jgi:uncharacterized protein